MAYATPSPICAAQTKARLPISCSWIQRGCRRSSMHSASSRCSPTMSDNPGNASFAIGAALTLAANALARRPRELPAQLLARLSPEDAPELDASLKGSEHALHRQLLFRFVPPSRRLAPSCAASRGMRAWSPSVTVLADGRRALSGSRDKTLRLWDLETGAELRRFEGHEGWVTSVTVLADGRRALSGSWRPDVAAVGSRDRRRTAPLRGA